MICLAPSVVVLDPANMDDKRNIKMENNYTIFDRYLHNYNVMDHGWDETKLVSVSLLKQTHPTASVGALDK